MNQFLGVWMDLSTRTSLFILTCMTLLTCSTRAAASFLFAINRRPSSISRRLPALLPPIVVASMSADSSCSNNSDDIATTTTTAAAAVTTTSAADSTNHPIMNQYVDVHCHIIHDQFTGEEDDVTHRAQLAGLEYCVVNGLEPVSNRAVLELCSRHPNTLLPALGIYPLDACAHVIDTDNWNHPFVPPTKFDVDTEIDWIDQMCSVTDTATNKKIVVAIGECGLDAYYTTQSAELDEQERVLRKLIHVAIKHDLPLILHTRKAELRTFEILQEMNVTKADFHCFCGKTKLGKRIAEAGYYLSIPSVIARSESFRALVKVVPLSQLLTETDSPYQGPMKDVRNEPNTVPIGIKVIAEVKGITEMEAMMAIRTNFRRLMDR